MRDGPLPPITMSSSSSSSGSNSLLYGMSPLRGRTFISSSSPRGGSSGIRGMNNSNHNSIRNCSPLRGTGMDYTSTTSLLQEITVLRSRLRELEDDNKSSVVSNVEEDNTKLNTIIQSLRNDVAQLQEEKALQEQELMNQMAVLQSDHTKQLKDMQDRIDQKNDLNNLMNDKLQIIVLQKDELNDQLTLSNNERNIMNEQVQTITIERDELQQKLKDAKMENALARSKNDTEDKYTRLLEEQRESHMKELEQMKNNLASADLEIAESRSEMDQLHGEIEEMQTYREALLEEVTTVRLDFTEEKRVSRVLRKELGEMKQKVEKLRQEIKEKDLRLDHKLDDGMKKFVNEKDKLIEQHKEELDRLQRAMQDLENEKASLLSEVTILRLKMKEQFNKPLTIDTSNSSEDDYEENRPISPAEKEQLVKDMQGLESRLVQFHSKLADKETKISDLAASLSEERQSNKKLRTEIQQLKLLSSSAKSNPSRQRSSIGGSMDSQSELASLRNQNKALTNEVEELRKVAAQSASESTHNRVYSSSPYRKSTSTTSSLATEGRTKAAAPSLLLPPNLNRTATVANNGKSPRTPVSGLVATFERHMSTKNRSSLENGDISLTNESEADIADLRDQLKCEKLLVLDLQKQLRADKEVIWDLQEKLRSEKNRIVATELQQVTSSKNSATNCASPTSLVAELRESRKENERLQATLREVERMQSNHAVTAKERAELNKLRSDAVYASMERDDSEQTITECNLEIQRLRDQLKQRAKTRSSSAFVEEKKMDCKYEDVTELEKELKQKELELELLHSKHQTYEDETEEELGRLRCQVDALQSELESAMTKIESLQLELGGSGMDREAIERQLKAMELELTMSKARHADLVVEHAERIEELEGEIEALEQSNTNLATEVPAQAQKDFDNETEALTTELHKCQMKMADLEMESSLKIKDLQNRIQSLEVELEEEKNEKESLHKCLEVSETAASEAPKLNAEINRLSSQLTAAQLNKANSDRESLGKLRALEDEVEILEIEATEELAKKINEIDSLKVALERKEEDIQRLEKEKQLLCVSMNDASSSRKGELEELQAELLDMTTKTKTQGREIQTLKMKLEEHESRNDDISSKYQRRIQELEEEIRIVNDTARKTYGDRDSILQLKSENAQLRETLRDVKIERRQLKEKFDSLTQEKTASRSAQLIRERNNELQEEVEKLTKRLKKLEASVTRYAI
jgi:chromosome segregation ATPase